MRLHYLVYVEPGTAARRRRAPRSRRCWWPPPAPGPTTSRRRWSSEHGEERGAALYRRYGDAFPAAYRADWVPRSALADIAPDRGARAPTTTSRCSLYRPLEAPPRRAAREALPRRRRRWRSPTCCRCSRTWAWRWPTSGPTRSPRATATRVWIYDFGLTYARRGRARGRRRAGRVPGRLHPRLARRRRERRLQPAGAARRPHLARDDRAARDRPLPAPGRHDLQRPLRGAGARRATRASRACWSSCSAPASTPRRADAERGRRARRARSRRRSTPSRASTRTASCAASSTSCRRRCAPTSSSARRTARPKPYLSFKLDPAQLPWLPLPRPRFEIFVYSPRTEGVHLRGGKVARGGIRWSDRREDFRTEVLGLMKAQMVKNAVIVPVGAKGGFVVKQPPAGDDREALLAEVVACYRTFISGLLDLTDNIVGRRDRAAARRRALRRRRPLPGGRRRQGHGHASPTSPTSIVGASTASGSATPSPRAARPATTTRRWASPRAAPGSRSSATSASSGTTSRARTSPWSAIGDMSGDVFGNGMLLSRAHPAGRRLRPPPRLPRPRPRRRARASRSASACSSCRARRGTTTTAS